MATSNKPVSIKQEPADDVEYEEVEVSDDEDVEYEEVEVSDDEDDEILTRPTVGIKSPVTAVQKPVVDPAPAVEKRASTPRKAPAKRKRTNTVSSSVGKQAVTTANDATVASDPTMTDAQRIQANAKAFLQAKAKRCRSSIKAAATHQPTSSTASSQSMEVKTPVRRLPVLDVEKTIERYIASIKKQSREQLEEWFGGNPVLVNYDLQDKDGNLYTDPDALKELRQSHLRNKNKAKIYLRAYQAVKLREYLESVGLPIAGFAGENTRKQNYEPRKSRRTADNATAPEQAREKSPEDDKRVYRFPLPNGLKRKEEVAPGEPFTKTVYIGEPFQLEKGQREKKDTPFALRRSHHVFWDEDTLNEILRRQTLDKATEWLKQND